MMRPRLRSGGMTLVEIAISCAAVLTGLAIAFEVTTMTTRAQSYITAADEAQARASKLIADLRGACFASKRVYQDDAEGRAYFAALDTTEFPPVADALLPIIDTSGRLEADAPGVRRTGNAMMFACEASPMDVRTATNRTRRVDVVRFFSVYPTQRNRRVTRALATQTDLMRFASIEYADRASIDAVTDVNDKRDVVLALRAAGITRAWVAGGALATAFFDLKADGTIAASPVAAPRIELPKGLPLRNLLGDSHMTVAGNDPLLKVPTFAEVTSAAPSYPGGFEVKVVGPFGGRQVLVRLVILAGVPNNTDARAQTSRIFSVRDL